MSKQSQAAVWVWVGVGLVAVTAFCGVLGFQLWTGFVEVRDTLTPEKSHFAVQGAVNGHVAFHLTYDQAAVSVSTLTVLDDTDQVLWQIDGHAVGLVPVVVYGRLQVVPGARWTQLVPADGSPPPDVRGKKISVVVEGKCHGHFGVGPQTVETSFDVPK
jgi:hypothetical protein